MIEKERRKSDLRAGNALARELNEAQRLTLVDMERFGWELKFIRRPMFQKSVAVIFDPDRKSFAVLEEDGTLNEDPGFDIRA
ncbi:MAG: hypothetical protein ABJB02_00155 [Dokdonella sp.]